MARDFYVLVIDDKEEVCRRVREKISGSTPPGIRQSNRETTVTCKTVHVALQRQNKSGPLANSRWTFAAATWRALREAADLEPDLIIIDYIYIDRDVATMIKESARKEEASENLVEGRALNPADLKRWVLEAPHIPDSARRCINRRIFDTRSAVYLHSYTPQGLTAVVGNVDVRKRKLHQVFPHAEVTLVDTRGEFFNNDEFDWPNADSKYDSRYYPYQVAVFFDQVVKTEIARNQLRSNRYLRVRRTVGSVAVISAIGAGIGLAGAWVGALVGELTQSGAVLHALALGAGLLVMLLLLGSVCPFLFEMLMRKILSPSGRTDED